MALRKMLEVVARGRKVKRHISINGREIPLYVSPDAQLKYLKRSGSWDQDLIQLAAQYVKPGDDVWDIGANCGVFSFAAATMSQTGNIFAFEADTFLVEVIKSSRRLNGMKNVQAIPIAIAAEDGFAEFQIAERGRASNSLSSAGGHSQMGGVRDSFLVPTLSGESVRKYLGSGPQFIKIDVEGAELMVINGLIDVLKNERPFVYVELGAESKADVINLLSDLGYSSDIPVGDSTALANYLFKPTR